MIALRNLLILTDLLAVALLIVAYDVMPNDWIIYWCVFMLSVLGAITAIQYATRNEAR